jgi:hypothetical protein
MEQIEELKRLGYEVGVAQDHSENDEVPLDIVYAVEGFGFSGYVSEEADADRLLETHEDRVEEIERGPELP